MECCFEELGDVYRLLRTLGSDLDLSRLTSSLGVHCQKETNLAVRLIARSFSCNGVQMELDLDTYRHVRELTLESLHELRPASRC